MLLQKVFCLQFIKCLANLKEETSLTKKCTAIIKVCYIVKNLIFNILLAWKFLHFQINRLTKGYSRFNRSFPLESLGSLLLSAVQVLVFWPLWFALSVVGFCHSQLVRFSKGLFLSPPSSLSIVN